MSARLGFESYPMIDPAELGQWPNAGYGSLEAVRCHLVEAGAASALASDMDASSTTMTLADASRFPAAPFDVQVGMELMRATSVDGNTLTVQRADGGTRAAAHSMNLIAYECRPRYVYLVAEHPVKAIDALYIDGARQLSGFTAYTGQGGDELAGYEGRAVIALGASPNATRQYNRSSTRSIEIGAAAACFSSSSLVDGSSSSHQAIGALGAPCAWVSYAADAAPGSPITQTHTVEIENPGASDLMVRLMVRSSGARLIERAFTIPAAERATLSIEQEGGELSDGLSVAPSSGTLHVHSITKTMRMDSAMYEPEPDEAYAEPIIDALCSGHALGASGRHAARIAYKDSTLGAVHSQTHIVTVEELAGQPCRVRIAASTGEFMEADVAANATETLTLSVPGGSWQDATGIIALLGRFRVAEASKRVAYHSAGALGSLAAAALPTARRVIGETVSVDVQMCADSDGSYAGAGTLIERPDHIARHFITHHMGMDAATIDLASFNEAGASYAYAINGGYTMGFLIDRSMRPSRILSGLAMQCRSTLHHSGGLWRMRYLPDIAPAPEATISQSELAGDGSHFIFSRTPLTELANSIAARYAWRDSDGAYAGLANAEDASSVALYGRRSLEVELWAVRDAAMAAHLLAHILRERSTPRLMVEFSVFFEHFALGAGDTIEIGEQSPGQTASTCQPVALYTGRRFFIEDVRRLDKYTTRLKGREWWVD